MNSKMLAPNINEYQETSLEKHIEDIAIGNKEALSNLYKLTKTSVYSFEISILKILHDAQVE